MCTESADRAPVDWAFWGGDPGGAHYSPLADINAGNVAGLRQAWVWKTGETALPEYGTRPGIFENTPLMIDHVLYATTPYNKVVALDPETGAELWSYDPKSYVDGQPPNGSGYIHRGHIAAWRDARNAGQMRIFLNTRYRLISLDAKTGKPVSSFGDNGVVDLSQGLVWQINKMHYTETSPAVIYKDLVIVGNGVGDRLMYKNDPPGDVRAFDARTGKRVWTFHTIPQAGEFGNETWGNEAWKFTGHTNVWTPFTIDERRGLVYLPVSTPSNDFYGGNRPGNGLFGETLVCLDANSGQRKWHFQIVHHGLWDYDLATPPVMATITVDGKKIDAVVQLTKEGFAFVFDRVTGKPVWPIEERPVPESDIAGEHASPTQPFPTKPPAYTPQGVTLDDAFDLTPELKAEAQTEMQKYRLGPLFTPPSLKGTLMRPGIIGGANWGGGAFDPDTGMVYIKTTNCPGGGPGGENGPGAFQSARFRSRRGVERRSGRASDLPRRLAFDQTALRSCDGHRSESWNNRVAAAVRGLARAPQQSGTEECETARRTGHRRPAGRNRDQRRASLRGRRGHVPARHR